MSLVKFYENTLESLGLETSEDGFIFIKTERDRIQLTTEGKPLVLPTKDHIKTLLVKGDSGDIEVTKFPYNPLNENVIKGDTLSLKKTKIIVEQRLSMMLSVAGDLLLTLASDPKLQKKTSHELNKFLSSLSEAQAPNIKKLVDDTSIANWNSIFTKMFKTDKFMASIYLKKSGVYKGTKYNRLATLKSPLLTELEKADRETPVYGVKLRPKEITINMLMLKFMIGDLDENNVMSIGSNNTESPAFIALMSIYIKLATRLNKLIKSLKHIDVEEADKVMVDLKIKLSDLDSVNLYRNEASHIPNELDLNRKKEKKHIPEFNAAMINSVAPNHNAQAAPVNQPAYDLSTPLPPNVNQQPEEKGDIINKILYGNNIPVVPTMPKQQNYQPQQQMGYMQQMQQPQGYPMTGGQQPYNPMMQTQQPQAFQQPQQMGFAQSVQQMQQPQYNPMIPNQQQYRF